MKRNILILVVVAIFFSCISVYASDVQVTNFDSLSENQMTEEGVLSVRQEIEEDSLVENRIGTHYWVKEIVVGLIVICILILFKVITYQKKKFDREKRKLKEQIKSASNKIAELESQTEDLKQQLALVKEWEHYVKAAVPTINGIVQEYIAVKEAKEFAERFEDLAEIEVTSDKFNILSEAYEKYNNLSFWAKEKIPGLQIQKIIANYELAADLYAKEAEAYIRENCGACDGKKEYKDKLSAIKQYYALLPLVVRTRIHASIINELNSKKLSAEADFKNYRNTSE